MSQLMRIGTIGVHDPDRPVAVPLVAAESELGAVWRPDEALCGAGRRFDDPLVAAVRLARDDHFAATSWVKTSERDPLAIRRPRGEEPSGAWLDLPLAERCRTDNEDSLGAGAVWVVSAALGTEDDVLPVG
jgi:hypothetical protein